MLGDRELLSFRLGYCDLLVSLLLREPPGELLRALGEGIRERAAGARRLSPLLGEGWEEIERFLAGTPADDLAETVRDEYTRLFLGPHGVAVHPYESFYLTGSVLDRPLAVLRGFLGQLGIEKSPGFAEPEDFIAFELDVLRSLIRRQEAAMGSLAERKCLDLQASFLKRHLLVWGPTACRDLASAPGAAFYRGVARILEGFLELERALFREWGEEEEKSLEEARASFAGRGRWKGPLFDTERLPTEGGQ